jgi:hypothetical protein
VAMDECDGLNECTRKYQINKKSDIMPKTFNLTFNVKQRACADANSPLSAKVLN